MGFEEVMLWVGAYVTGSVPFGRIVGKVVRGIDVSRVGSGNIGATNVARALGVKWGVVTLVLDVLKGCGPVAVAYLMFCGEEGLACEWVASLAGVAAVAGHQFSVFEGFQGGKGVATALGVYLVTCPLAAVMALCVFVVVVYKWDWVSLGSLSAACSAPLFFVVLGEAWPIVVSSGVIAGLIVLGHKENIDRLLRGEERKWREKRDLGKNM